MKALILAGLLTVPGLVAAPHCGAPKAMLQGMIAKKLALTPEQQQSIHKVMEAHHPALKAKAEAIFEARTAMIQALADPQTGEAQIREMEAKASAAHLAMELEVNQIVKEVAPLLSEEQRGKAKEMVADAIAHVGMLRGWMMGQGECSKGQCGMHGGK